MKSDKIKLCFVLSSLRAGGAERVVSILANSFDTKDSFDVTIITVNEAMPFYKLSNTIQLISLDIKHDKNPIRNSSIRIRKLIKAFGKVKPSIIISFSSTTSCEAIVAAKYKRIPIIISERANPKVILKSFYWKIFRRLTFPFANHLVCQTTPSLEFYNWVKNKSIIANPVDFTKIDVQKKEKIILAIGSLIYRKGFDMLIDAFIKTQGDKSTEQWNLIILGEGVERANLEQQIRNSGFKNKIKLKGNVSDPTEFYSKASIFALSSRSEGLPNVLLEAISFGLPSVSFNCEFGPFEILDGGNIGLLVKNGDVNELSENLKLLMNDSVLRSVLSKKAFIKAKYYTTEKITEDWCRVIHNVLLK